MHDRRPNEYEARGSTVARRGDRGAALRWALVATALAASAVLAVPASSDALTISNSKTRVTQLGGFHPNRNDDLGHAIHAFGAPTVRLPVVGRRWSCIVTWRKLSLRIQFANFAGANPCTRRGGHAQSMAIGFSKRWRTARHLRVGNSVRQLKHRYLFAERHGTDFWLQAATSNAGGRHRYPVLAARTHKLRWVSGFEGWIGGAR